MSRAKRLLSLVQILRRYRNPVSAQRLADELNVSTRSVYRDVQTLRDQGANIDGEAGLGYLLRPGFLLPPLMFTDDELEAIVLGLRLTHEHADPALGKAAVDVVAKLRAVLPREMKATIDEVALLAGPQANRPTTTIDLATVRQAMRSNHKARIEYTDEKGAHSQRTIWPLGIGFFERATVIVAWCETRKSFRAFRSDRVVSWQTLGEKLPRPRMGLLRDWRATQGIPAQLAQD